MLITYHCRYAECWPLMCWATLVHEIRFCKVSDAQLIGVNECRLCVCWIASCTAEVLHS